MAIKRFTIDWTQAGLTVYGMIVRENDGFLLNDADGSFAAAPPDPYVSFTAHPTIIGRYFLNEDRTVWLDGPYTIAIYSQLGGAPTPATDQIIGTGQAVIYADAIRSTVIYPPGSGGLTLATIVARLRNRLDDAVEPYLWSNEELTDYVNEVLNELCRDIPIIEDGTNTQMCRYSVLAGETLVNLNQRITVVKKGKLESQPRPLAVRTAQWMDASYPDWENAAAGVPSILVTEGVGTDRARLYPPSTADEVLWLTVYRLQLVDMFWGTDQDYQPEVPARYHDKLFNGVLMKAYGKQDVDTFDAKKQVAHERQWLRDKEEIKRAVVKSRQRQEIITPYPGVV